MQDKRKTVRVEKALVVKYAQSTPEPLRWDSEPLRWDSTTVKNISASGILINTFKVFAQNEKLLLRFLIPTDPFNPLEVTGEVVDSFTHGHGTRIKFIDLTEQQKKLIGDYVEYLLKKNK